MGCCKWCCIVLLVAFVVIGISTGLFAGLFPYPSHASCKVEWEFGKECNTVQSSLIDQMNEWSDVSCSGKQQCGYKYLETKGDTIFGRRNTSFLSFVDHFNFTFSDNANSCSVVGKSESDAWYAVLDFGGNYCNMKNLIIGKSLNKNDPSYEERSANGICTMYSIAHCNLY